MSEWRDIESAPKDGSLVLLCDIYERFDGHRIFVARWCDGNRHKEWVCHGYRKQATHWMPLPEPPGGAA